MKARLVKILTHFGYTATKFADEIGVQRSGISHILSGRNQPSYDFMVKTLSKFPDINAEWLILGKGAMLKINAEQNSKAGSTVTPDNSVKVTGQNDLFHSLQEQKTDNSTLEPKKEVTYVTSLIKILLLNNDGTFEVYHSPGKV
jgi:transcriptional regulator with XRE-family HTH domain